MPLLSTRGGLTSRGFGQLNGGKATTLRTYTFPAGSSVFTVPSTTNILVSAVGAGADGSPGGTTTGTFGQVPIVINYDPNGLGIYGPLTGEYAQTVLDSQLAQFQKGGDVYWAFNYYFICPNGKYYVGNYNDRLSTRVIPNTSSSRWSYPLPSGAIPYNPDRIYVANIDFQAYFDYPASTGASTTGFGLTFPGGTGGASSTTTFNNVAVTPNQTYVITNNKSLTITYYA